MILRFGKVIKSPNVSTKKKHFEGYAEYIRRQHKKYVEKNTQNTKFLLKAWGTKKTFTQKKTDLFSTHSFKDGVTTSKN